MSPLELPGTTDRYEVLDAVDVDRIEKLRSRYPSGKSAILPALWILQRKEGILTAGGMREVARALQLPPGPVEAVASFYSMFFFKPHGRYLVEVCTSMSCMLNGAGAVMRRMEEGLGVSQGGTTEDNLATLLEVECLGACGGAPAAQVNHWFFENLTPARVDEMVADMKAGRLRAAPPPALASVGDDGPLHPVATGDEAAARDALVDLVNPGANRVPVAAGGAAGTVVDLVKGGGYLLSSSEHPAEGGYVEAPGADESGDAG